MKKATILILTTFFCWNVILKGQTINDSDTTLKIENAEYLKEDLTKLLLNNMTYPLEALKKHIKGEVILSLFIDKNGKLDSLNILSSPDIMLSQSSIVSFNNVENEWSPCKINGKPIGKKYLIVFRYRIYLNTEPPKYKESADKFFEKQKYKKALNFYNKAIKENQYDYKLFESRSKIKEILDDLEGAKRDSEKSDRLQNEIISLVDIAAIGIIR